MVLKRYTPPTCTLEITAKSSPLSRWAGQPVFKSLSFELRLDDPRLPDTKHVTLKGDRTQLEALHNAVSNYVQNLLGESRPWESNLYSELDSTVAETDSLQPTRSAVVLDTAVNPYEIKASAPNTSHLPVHPHLEPRGLLTHNLFLGSLSVAESGPVVDLSTLQLFDLATALDEYNAEVMALPNLNRSSKQTLSSPWLRAAAMVIASVGLTTGIIKLLDRPVSDSQTALAPGNQQISGGASAKPLAGVATPIATPTANPTASPIPNSTATPTANPTASPTLPPLPPPPINATASPSPSLPPIAPSATPETNNKPSPIQQPALLFPANGSAPSVASGSAPTSQQQTIVIPAPAEAPISATKQPPPPPNILPPVPPRLGPAAAPPLPPSLSASQFPISPQPSLPRSVRPTITPGNQKLPPLSDIQPQAELDSNQQGTESKKDRTLFDTIPQVSEAKTYFEERWKPPEGMQETLEYSVQIDEKGSIQSIIPMGKAAGDYIDRTNMPLIGEPFVSAVTNGNNPRIRVVLRPNGRVQTFLESTN
jgi:Domain of unknown function (DUF4335)